MKKIFSLALLALSAQQLAAQTFPVVDLHVNGPRSNRINIVVLPDGFTAAEQTSFAKSADTIRKDAFRYTPLKEYSNFFNAYCIKVPSNQSGVNHPRTATDVPETDPVMVVDNYFSSTFDYGGVHRALVATDYTTIDNVLAANLPDYDLVYVLSNTEMYGGTGGAYATGTLNSYSVKIAVHEWGHTFANLSDEYWPGWSSEKPNSTTEADPTKVRWKNWLGYKSVGVYPFGYTGSVTWYRPHENCMMQYLDTVLCPVCKEAFIDQLYRLVFPMENPSPAVAATVNYSGSPLPFSFRLIKPEPNTFNVRWELNGMPFGGTDTSVNVPGTALISGLNELKAIATDTTELARSYRPASGYQFSLKWKIDNKVTGIATVGNAVQGGKFAYKVYPVPAQGTIFLDYENSTDTRQLSCSIFDISGRLLLQRDAAVTKGHNQVPLDIRGLAPGNYQLQLKGSDVNVTTKISVE